MVYFLWALFLAASGLAPTERQHEQEVGEALVKMWKWRQQSPETVIRLCNRSGEPIDACEVVSFSDPKSKKPYTFSQRQRLAGPFGKEPAALEWHDWPEQFVLGSVTLIRAGREEPHNLNFVCRPGGKFVVIIEREGKVVVKGE